MTHMLQLITINRYLGWTYEGVGRIHQQRSIWDPPDFIFWHLFMSEPVRPRCICVIQEVAIEIVARLEALIDRRIASYLDFWWFWSKKV